MITKKLTYNVGMGKFVPNPFPICIVANIPANQRNCPELIGKEYFNTNDVPVNVVVKPY